MSWQSLVPVMILGVAQDAHPTSVTTPSILLKNAANSGVKMPAAGLGTGCNIGGCNIHPGSDMVSYNMSLQWFKLGGRRVDGADSYGCEPGIGAAMASMMQDYNVPRSDFFIVSKIGPGGLAWPLGYNETLQQAREIVANYSTTYVDLLLVHWPTNYGPCSYHGPKPSIPTTDPNCDTSKPTYSEKECRLSTWRGMIEVWKLGLARAIGVSNFNTTHLKEIAEAGLDMPSVNQCPFSPVSHGLDTPKCTVGDEQETCRELLQFCKNNGIVYNGYSPFGGPGRAASTLSNPTLMEIAQRHNVSAAQVVLNWQWSLGIPTNPEATNPSYQVENLNFFGFQLSETEIAEINTTRL